ncbi:MAG: hypothetical protein WKF97_25165 [Chitinophagaceae bacterium]
MKKVLYRSLFSQAGVFGMLIILMMNGSANAQALIHSHNDYLRKKPFYEAVEAKAFSLEADVFFKDSLLCVAHTALEISKSSTLDKLYLEPLIRYCLDIRAGKKDTMRPYLPVLMIDIKNDQRKVMALLLLKLANMEQRLKDEGIDTMPLIVISGNRPSVDSFKQYPSYVQFDGRPSEQYNDSALAKVAFISDQYLKYSTWTGKGMLPVKDSATIGRLVRSVHNKGKKLRLWNTPDSSLAWSIFKNLGVDIINTDQPVKCSNFFSSKKVSRRTGKL